FNAARRERIDRESSLTELNVISADYVGAHIGCGVSDTHSTHQLGVFPKASEAGAADQLPVHFGRARIFAGAQHRRVDERHRVIATVWQRDTPEPAFLARSDHRLCRRFRYTPVAVEGDCARADSFSGTPQSGGAAAGICKDARLYIQFAACG